MYVVVDTRDGRTPLHNAAKNGFWRLSEVRTGQLYRVGTGHPDWRTHYCRLLLLALTPIIQLLLQHQAAVNFADRHDDTALHLAKNAEVVSVLMQYEAKPDFRNRYRKVRKEESFEGGDGDKSCHGHGLMWGVCMYVYVYGSLQLPLHVHVETGDIGAVSALLRHSACVALIDATEELFEHTALHMAVRSGQVRTLAASHLLIHDIDIV